MDNRSWMRIRPSAKARAAASLACLLGLSLPLACAPPAADVESDALTLNWENIFTRNRGACQAEHRRSESRQEIT